MMILPEEIKKQIKIGEFICKRLKSIYFSDKTWFECYRAVGYKFTDLKRKARKFYVGMKETDILNELISYGDTDLKELLEG